jgi:hypothetical protein
MENGIASLLYSSLQGGVNAKKVASGFSALAKKSKGLSYFQGTDDTSPCRQQTLNPSLGPAAKVLATDEGLCPLAM